MIMIVIMRVIMIRPSAHQDNDNDDMKGKEKTKERPFRSRWAEGRNLDPENPDRQGSGEQTVEEALYVIGKHDHLGNDTKGNVIFSFQGRISWGEM